MILEERDLRLASLGFIEMAGHTQRVGLSFEN